MFVRFVVHTNRCFCDAFASANIWLYHVLHDNLHCLVFKEHPWFSLEAFEKLFRESASIWYLGAFALSRRNSNFFFRSSRLHQIIVVCGAVLSLSAADLHYITRFQWRCQHFFEIFFKSVGSISALLFNYFITITTMEVIMKKEWKLMMILQKKNLKN